MVENEEKQIKIPCEKIEFTGNYNDKGRATFTADIDGQEITGSYDYTKNKVFFDKGTCSVVEGNKQFLKDKLDLTHILADVNILQEEVNNFKDEALEYAEVKGSEPNLEKTLYGTADPEEINKKHTDLFGEKIKDIANTIRGAKTFISYTPDTESYTRLEEFTPAVDFYEKAIETFQQLRADIDKIYALEDKFETNIYKHGKQAHEAYIAYEEALNTLSSELGKRQVVKNRFDNLINRYTQRLNDCKTAETKMTGERFFSNKKTVNKFVDLYNKYAVKRGE